MKRSNKLKFGFIAIKITLGPVEEEGEAVGHVRDQWHAFDHEEVEAGDLCLLCCSRRRDTSLVHGKMGHHVACYVCAKTLIVGNTSRVSRVPKKSGENCEAYPLA